MTVKEANKYIESIDKEISNLKKFLRLDDIQSQDIKDKVGLNGTFAEMVNTAVIAMIEYKKILKEKIDNTEIDLGGSHGGIL